MHLADLSLFLGRFHPVVVHLPIGFLILAALLEWWPGMRMQRAASISWGLGAASAVTAAFLGWLLAGDGSYGDDAIFWHKWLGIGVAALAVVGYLLTRKRRPVNKAFAAVVVLLLLLAGHQGGKLTHGENFLFEHSPEFVQTMVGMETQPPRDWSATDVDSINIYAELIQPIIVENCLKCHHAGKQNGGLRMDSPTHLLAGGDNGSIIVAGNAMGSEWVRRITLPLDHKKSMPPDGNPLGYTQVEVIKHWIDAGADTLALLQGDQLPESLKALLLRDYNLDVNPKTFVEKLKVASVDEATFDLLAEMGWAITRLSDKNGALEIKAQPRREIDGKALHQLADLAGPQVVYLYLDDQHLTSNYQLLSKFPNLNRLKLNGSDVGNNDLKVLGKLQFLESLNLYATAIGDEALETLTDLKSIKRLYLWQTAISEAGAQALAEKLPNTEINTGFQLNTNTAQANKTTLNDE